MKETLSDLHDLIRKLYTIKERLLPDGYKPVINTIIEAIGIAEGAAIRLEEKLDAPIK